MRFRASLGISEFVELPLDVAVLGIPGCQVRSLRNLAGVLLQDVIYARTVGYNRVGAFAKRIGDSLYIVFNDAHPVTRIRVNVMEEIFHVLLGHRPDIVTVVPRDGNCRTHDPHNEYQAEECAKAALLPFAALQALLAQQVHIARIAEHFGVTMDLVHHRIGVTDLGELMNAQIRQYALVPIQDLAVLTRGAGP
jgi:Zn-dependent peptidase ImmA (M78 family)